MAISVKSLRRKNDVGDPPRIMIYGPEGVGKTTTACNAPGSILLPVEEGWGDLDPERYASFPLLKTFGEVEEAIGSLAQDDHDFNTLVLDSADWMERIIWSEFCARNGLRSIEDMDYGKGYTQALDLWKYMLDGLQTLRDERRMSIIILAHASIRKFDSPDTEAYDRYSPKLHESAKGIGANPLLREWVDAVFFQDFVTSIVRDDNKVGGKGKGRVRAVGGGQRVIYTTKRPALISKNRWSMPDQILLPNTPEAAWNAIAQHIPYYRNQMNQTGEQTNV